MTAQQTFNEALDSLTGYEEERIESHFGADIFTLLKTNATRCGRALIFIDQIRHGMKSATADENKVVQAAKKHTQGLTIAQVNDYFADDEDGDDVMADEPESESGKDASASASEPVSSPPSVS